MEAIGDAEHGVDGKEEREALGLAGIKLLFGAGVPPTAAQSLIALVVGAQYHGGGVVHEVTKSSFTEAVIGLGIQDEVMPDEVNGL